MKHFLKKNKSNYMFLINKYLESNVKDINLYQYDKSKQKLDK